MEKQASHQVRTICHNKLFSKQVILIIQYTFLRLKQQPEWKFLFSMTVLQEQAVSYRAWVTVKEINSVGTVDN